MMAKAIVKRGKEFCVLHAHPKKKGSKTDKPIGSIIHCFPTKKKALAQHKAIIMSKKERGEM